MAAKKQLTPAELKAAKQKKIAIIGSVLLVALLAFQVPRVLKMMNAKPPVASAASATTTTPAASPTPAVPGAPATAAPAAASTATPASVDGIVVNADLSPQPLDGQLPALTATFTSKDPFRAQTGTATPTDSSSSTSTPTTGGTKKGKQPGDSIVPGSGNGTSTTPSAPTTPQAPPTAATISVNGVDTLVGVDTDFPAASPLFHLVALTAKTAKISIAGGGSLSSGAPTITLRLGVPLTLMNTADGTRYRLVLVSTAAATVTPATPATTTTTTTTG